jgi:hypothetical protein
MRKREMITTLVGEPARVAHNRQRLRPAQHPVYALRRGYRLADANGLTASVWFIGLKCYQVRLNGVKTR